jgi:uncharacterized membrane protein
MEIVKFVLTFLVGYATIIIGDYIWLGYVVRNFTIREFWELVVVENGSIKINLVVWLLAWAVIALLVVVFVTKSPNVNSVWTAIFYGAIMWFLSYAMYDLTNLTFLKNYSLSFTLVDVAWGTFLCSMIALTTYIFSNWINKVL